MKRLIVILLAIIMVLAVTGCGGDSYSASDEYKAIAKEQDLDVDDLVDIVDELAQLTADKYGITKEEYIQNTEDAGKTVLEEMQIEADYMGLTIKQLYEYEKTADKYLTDDQKEVMEGMGEAKEEIENLAEDLNDSAESLVNEDGEEAKVVKGDPEEKCIVGLIEKVNEEDASMYYELLYKSDEDADTLVDYFKDLLKDTNDYYVVSYPGKGGVISGTIDGKSVNISVDGEEDPVEVDFTYFK